MKTLMITYMYVYHTAPSNTHFFVCVFYAVDRVSIGLTLSASWQQVHSNAYTTRKRSSRLQVISRDAGEITIRQDLAAPMFGNNQQI